MAIAMPGRSASTAVSPSASGSAVPTARRWRGSSAAPLRRFRPVGELVRTGSDQAPRIQFPLNGSRIDVDRSNNGQFSAMPVKVAGGVLPLTMLVNGISVGEIDSRRQRLVDPPGPGFARLTVIDATGAADTVVIRVQ